ncbi:MAG: FecR family protein, partial [Flexibacteraceae bacterium]
MENTPKQDIGILITKVVCGEATEFEIAHLQSLANQSETIKAEWEATQKLWSLGFPNQLDQEDFTAFNSKEAWQKVSKTIQSESVKPTKVIHLNWRWAAAASVVLALLTFTIVRTQIWNTASEVATVIKSNPSAKTQSLPDGSDFTLSKDAELSYLKGTYNQERAVSLKKGKVYLHVQKAAGAKFTVQTAEALVTVLGTKFSVEQMEGNTKVLVEEGRVKVQNPSLESDSLILTAGMGAYVSKGKLELLVPEPNEMAWANKKLVFESMPLHKVITNLSSAYNKPILLKGTQLRNEKITAQFTNQELDEVLQ